MRIVYLILFCQALLSRAFSLTQPQIELKDSGQPEDSVRIYRAIKSHAIGMGVNFNAGDLALDFNGNRSIVRVKGLSLIAFFQIRPYSKKILLNERPNFRIQVREKRMLGGVGLRRDFFMGNNMGFYLSGAIAGSWGKYLGTGKNPGFYFRPQLGLGWFRSLTGPLHFRAGYEYSALVRSSPHRLYAGFDLNILKRIP